VGRSLAVRVDQLHVVRLEVIRCGAGQLRDARAHFGIGHESKRDAKAVMKPAYWSLLTSPRHAKPGMAVERPPRLVVVFGSGRVGHASRRIERTVGRLLAGWPTVAGTAPRGRYVAGEEAAAARDVMECAQAVERAEDLMPRGRVRRGRKTEGLARQIDPGVKRPVGEVSVAAVVRPAVLDLIAQDALRREVPSFQTLLIARRLLTEERRGRSGVLPAY
jgi:hypothetical protein